MSSICTPTAKLKMSYIMPPAVLDFKRSVIAAGKKNIHLDVCVSVCITNDLPPQPLQHTIDCTLIINMRCCLR